MNSSSNRTIGILTVLVLLCIGSNSTMRAQLCGQGTFSFRIVTQPTGEDYSFDYEFIPVSDSAVQAMLSTLVETNTKNGVQVYPRFSVSEGIIIPRHIATAVLDSVDKGRWLPAKRVVDMVEAAEERDKISPSGIIHQGMLQTGTVETLYIPTLLKVHRGRDTLFIIANFFGGCDHVRTVIWPDDCR